MEITCTKVVEKEISEKKNMHPTFENLCSNLFYLGVYRWGRAFLKANCGLILGTLCLSQVASAGAPFYLTFERSFRTTETAKLRIDFTDTEKPMRIRILKPTDQKAFLSQHRLVSRAYQSPQVNLNPAYYFFSGIKKLSSPLMVTKRLMSPAFRFQHLDTLPRPLKKPGNQPLAKVPPRFHIDPPKGMTIVADTYFDLLRDGDLTRDEVPGFEDWVDDNSHQYRQLLIDLPKVPSGIYLVEGLQGLEEGQALLQVTDLNVMVKQSTKSLTVVATNSHDRSPVRDLSVSIRNNQGSWQTLGKTQTNGTLHSVTREDYPGELLVRVGGDDEEGFALVSTNFLSSSTNRDSLFLFTDRPIFRPGEDLYFKGILQSKAQTGLASYEMQVLHKDTPVIMDEPRITLGAEGSFSGKLSLPAESEPGLYTIQAVSDDSVYQGELRVRDYKKPTFFMTSQNEAGQLRPNETFKVDLKAQRYAAGLPPKARYEVFVYRKIYEEPQWVSEAGHGLVTGSDYFGKTTGAATQGIPTSLYSSLSDRDTEVIKDSGGFSGTWASAAAFNEAGEATIEVKLPAEVESSHKTSYTYTIVVKARDLEGTSAVWTKDYFDTPSGLVLQMKVPQPLLLDGFYDNDATEFSKTNQTSAVGATSGTPVLLRSLYADGRPAPHAHGTVQALSNALQPILIDVEFDTNERGEAEVIIPLQDVYGKININGYLAKLNKNPLPLKVEAKSAMVLRPKTADDSLNRGGDIEIYPLADVLDPQETTKVVLLLPEQWGENGKEEGLIYETISTDEITKFEAVKIKGRTIVRDLTAPNIAGISGFHYSASVATKAAHYTEKNLTFRIIPRDKLLKVTLELPLAPSEPFSTVPLKVLVTDQLGAPQKGVEVAVSVVDEAVYAISPEIRPKIIDFFSPLPRLNIQNFFASHLKGYGYADTIKTPHYSFGALKSRTQLALRRAKDTAGFFPHLMTDDAGIAQTSLTLPENQTIWRVNAIASTSQGRFGEGQGNFRTVANYDVRVVLPEFLREGDEIDVPVVMANKSQKAESFSLNMTVPKSFHLEPPSYPQVGIDKGSEALNVSRLVAQKTDPGSDSVALEESFGLSAQIGTSLSFETDYTLKKRPRGVLQYLTSPMVMSTGGAGHHDVQAVFPVGANIKSVSVMASPGYFGLVQKASRYLLRYPYGCTEQLVSSTMPNLVYLDVHKNHKLKLNAYEQRAQSRAKMHALRGIEQILSRQHPDGSFGMWFQAKEADVVATVLAMDLLQYAEEIGLWSDYQIINRSRQWLRNSWISQWGDPAIKATLPDMSSPAAAFLHMRWATQSYFLGDVIELMAKSTDYQKTYRFAFLEAGASRGFYPDLIPKNIRESIISDVKQLILHKADAKSYLSAHETLGFPSGSLRVLAQGLGFLQRLGALDDETQRVGLKELAQGLEGVGYWNSTFDSAQIIQSLRGILAQEQADLKVLTTLPQVSTLSGIDLGKAQRVFGGLVWENISITSPEELSSLRFVKAPSHYWLSADFEVYTESPLQSETAAFAIDRQLYLLNGTNKVLLKEGDPLPQGALIASVLTMTRLKSQATDPESFGNLVVVKDPLPAIATGIEDDVLHLTPAGLIDEASFSMIKETKRYNDSIDRIVSWPLSAQSLQVSNLWENTFSGTAQIPPARIIAMYQEQMSGYTSSRQISTKSK